MLRLQKTVQPLSHPINKGKKAAQLLAKSFSFTTVALSLKNVDHGEIHLEVDSNANIASFSKEAGNLRRPIKRKNETSQFVLSAAVRGQSKGRKLKKKKCLGGQKLKYAKSTKANRLLKAMALSATISPTKLSNPPANKDFDTDNNMESPKYALEGGGRNDVYTPYGTGESKCCNKHVFLYPMAMTLGAAATACACIYFAPSMQIARDWVFGDSSNSTTNGTGIGAVANNTTVPDQMVWCMDLLRTMGMKVIGNLTGAAYPDGVDLNTTSTTTTTTMIPTNTTMVSTNVTVPSTNSTG